MNIKQIVDKIPKESDVQASQYPIADRIDDINAKMLAMIEKAVQIGSKEPISGGEVFSETFTVVSGSNTFDRTIPDMPLVRVDFKHSGSTRYCRVSEDPGRARGMTCSCGMKFFADEKRIFVENGVAGIIRITYAQGEVVLFTEADYSEDPPPSPTWIPEVFRPLLWLEPATIQAEYYKKDRAVSLRNQLTRLENLFIARYSRNSTSNARFDARDERSCFGGDNYR